MRLTTVLRQAANATTGGRRRSNNIKSLALSVYFKQPDFGMKEYDILSRASAFLLSVDPPDPTKAGEGSNDNNNNNNQKTKEDPYGHLERNERERERKLHQQEHQYTPLGGPADRELKDLGWLEFAPREVRPIVHCVCSSHVLAPFLWKDYYPQDWLNKVRQEHCVYSLEVFDPENPGQALGKFALNPYPIHHPEGRDVAFIHLKQEEESLKLMKDLGVQVHHLRDLDKVYEKGDQVTFDGFVVAEQNTADSQDFQKTDNSSSPNGNDGVNTDETDNNDESNDDDRIFYPYQETGQLAFHTQDRFFATTPVPLPEGLCGGPVLDSDGLVCGIVEGIVDKSNPNKDIAGSAAFMPNYVMTPFIEFAERFMLQRILPKGLFQKAVAAKTTNSLGGDAFQTDNQGRYQPSAGGDMWEETFERAIEQLRKNHSKEEVEAILHTIERERKEVHDILQKDGGDLEEVATRVRNRTLQIREMIHEEYRQGRLSFDEETNTSTTDGDVIEAEIIEKQNKT